MKKLLTALILSLTLLAPPSSGSALSPIQPLFGNNFGLMCTTFLINRTQKLWLSAAHCLEGDETYGIGALEATAVVVRKDAENDLVLFQGGLPAGDALELGEAPQLRDKVTVEGYAGQPVYLVFDTTIVGLGFRVPFPGGVTIDSVLIQAPPLQGMSGSPVLSRGRVVGLLHGTVGSVGVISLRETLRKFAGDVWK